MHNPVYDYNGGRLTDRPGAWTGEREELTPPTELNRRLKRLFGVNVYGDANYRVVWGQQRLSWVGGKHEYLSGSPIGSYLMPRYAPSARWYVEKWCSVDRYGTPESWDRLYTTYIDGRRVEELGPFPSRGEYEQITALTDPNGGFIPLDGQVVDTIVNLCRVNAEQSAYARFVRRKQETERQEREARRLDEEVLHDIDWGFGVRPRVSVPSTYKGLA
jgi:hypothetical protein